MLSHLDWEFNQFAIKDIDTDTPLDIEEDIYIEELESQES